VQHDEDAHLREPAAREDKPLASAASAKLGSRSASRPLDEMLLIADDESLEPMARRVRTETRRW